MAHVEHCGATTENDNGAGKIRSDWRRSSTEIGLDHALSPIPPKCVLRIAEAVLFRAAQYE
jgi:hypothetical protein